MATSSTVTSADGAFTQAADATALAAELAARLGGTRDDPFVLDVVVTAGYGIVGRWREQYDDLDLDRYLRRAHVSVLPYRWGTHSGWLELARDLGTRIVAPDCGYYTDQWADVVSYGNNETSSRWPASAACRDSTPGRSSCPADAAPRASRSTRAGSSAMVCS